MTSASHDNNHVFHPIRGWSCAIILCLLSTGCQTDAAYSDSAWQFARQTFSKRIHDAKFREGRLTQRATQSLLFAHQLHPGRYRFLHLAELVKTGKTSRDGDVAISIDGWPTKVRFKMEKRDGQWKVIDVGSTDAQRRILELLGPVGLPYVNEANAWTGGLAGRDGYGRPNGSVLVVVVGGRVYVDGRHEIPYRQNEVAAAIASALELRTTVAKGAHATYRPHVALALTQNAPTEMVSDLTQWAFRAGADAVQMLVRRRNNSPGWLGIGKIHTSLFSEGRLLSVRIARPHVTVYAVSADGAAPVIKVPAPKVEVLTKRLEKLAIARKPTGVVVETTSGTEHLTLVKAVASIQAGLHQVPLRWRQNEGGPHSVECSHDNGMRGPSTIRCTETTHD